MNQLRSFDRLAAIYRALEYAAFGRDLERARFVHLGHLRDRRSILILGEGDGRCLARIAALAPHARIDCLDLSAAMLARAKARLAGSPDLDRVNFHRADLLRTDLPDVRYDAVVTCFFLDCFTDEQAASVMARIDASLCDGARWWWADFAVPPRGIARLRAQAWLAVLYAFFRWQTGLAARRLPDTEGWFRSAGYTRIATASLQAGLLQSAVLARPMRR